MYKILTMLIIGTISNSCYGQQLVADPNPSSETTVNVPGGPSVEVDLGVITDINLGNGNSQVGVTPSIGLSARRAEAMEPSGPTGRSPDPRPEGSATAAGAMSSSMGDHTGTAAGSASDTRSACNQAMRTGTLVTAPLPGFYKLVIAPDCGNDAEFDYVALANAWPWLGRQGLDAAKIVGIWIHGDVLVAGTRR